MRHQRLTPEVDGNVEQYGDYTLLRVRTDRLLQGVVKAAPNAVWVGRSTVEVKSEQTWSLVTALRNLGYTIIGFDLN